jgi:uncharacterized membrane protein YbhN (UPF0104 family)
VTVRSSRQRRRILFAVVAVAVTAATFAVVLPRIASYGSVWRAASHLSWPWIAGLCAATALNILTFPLPWTVLLPELRYWRAVLLMQASTAVTLVLPGGSALGMGASHAILRSAGVRSAESGRAVAASGLWNQLSTFLFPLLAAAWLAVGGAASTSVVRIALIGGVLFIVLGGAAVALIARPAIAVTASALVARAVSRLPIVGRRARPLNRESVEVFRRDTISLLRRRWAALTLATAVNQLTGWVVLELSLRAVGVSTAQVSVGASFAAWSLGRLLASLPLTPGGVGFVELGLTGTLIGFGGPSAEVVAAVLIYRFLSVAPVLLVGGAGAVLLGQPAARQAAEELPEPSTSASADAATVIRKVPG